MDYQVRVTGERKSQVGHALGRPVCSNTLVGSLASSQIQHLTIAPFHVGRFRKKTIVSCFKPVLNTLCSLELRFLKTYTPASTFLIFMFPNLDDDFLERVNTTLMVWVRGEHDSEYILTFAGIFEYLELYDDTRPAFLSWIMGYPLWFHTISPGIFTRDDVPVFVELVTMCPPTLREIPHVMFEAGVWWPVSCLMVDKSLTMKL